MNFQTFRTRRWTAAWLQAAIVTALPFIRIHGESALRFDIPSLKLYFFGSVLWISEASFFLFAALLFFIGVMLFTVLSGRIWCGWMCPQTVLSDFSRLIEKFASRISRRRILAGALSQVFLILFSFFTAATLIWYFISPYEMIPAMVSFSPGPWTLGSLLFFGILNYLNLSLVRQKFCGSVCPYARLQSAFFDDRTLTIAFDPGRVAACRGCKACVRACPAGIDIREGLQIECINCAQCIDACAKQQRRFRKKTLIGYFFGFPGSRARKRLWPRVIGLSLAFGVIATLFAYQISARVPVNFWIMNDTAQNNMQSPARASRINHYTLFIENRSLQPAEYRLSISGIPDAELLMSRNPFLLPPNDVLVLKVYIILEKQYSEPTNLPVLFTLESREHPEAARTRQASFLILPLRANETRP